MNIRTISSSRTALTLALMASLPAAFAHVTLPPGGATAGSDYEAAFRVGHACQGAASTNGITVRAPEGFTVAEAQPRAGWTLEVKGSTVAWKADSAATALPTAERAEFIVRGRLTSTPGPLFFKVLQSCDKGSADWAEVPAGPTDKPGSPAARLDVLPAGVAPLDVQGAWVRTSVAGQSGTGAFMTVTAPSGGRITGASSPVAGTTEVHEMQMDGDVMRMRAVSGGLALPARQPVVLGPGRYHLMLTRLKQPLAVGSTVPLALEFTDLQGRKSVARLEVPVQASAPAAAAGSGSGSGSGMAGMHH